MTVLTELVPEIAALVEENASTAMVRVKQLRAEDMIARGVRGPGRGAQMRARDAVNIFLACILEHRYGVNVVEIVRLYRDLEFNPKSRQMMPLDGLTCWGVRTAGEALENLIDDYATGRIIAWAAGEEIKIKVIIDLRGAAIFIFFDRPKRDVMRGRYACADYAESGYQQTRQPVKRILEVSGKIFEKIAMALGPPPPS